MILPGLATAANSSAAYPIIDLGTLPGGPYSVAFGINKTGQVVGYSSNASGANHAFLWQNGVMTDLGTLPRDTLSEALGINEAGQVVGDSSNAFSAGHAFLWQNGV